MSASNAFETAILQHIFQNADIANMGDAAGLRGSTTAGSYWVALCVGDPGEAGTAVTNEADYTDYARVAIARSAAGFTVSGNECSNAAVVTFPACGATGNTVTHFAIVNTASGAGVLLGSAALANARVVIEGVAPSFAIGALKWVQD